MEVKALTYFYDTHQNKSIEKGEIFDVIPIRAYDYFEKGWVAIIHEIYADNVKYTILETSKEKEEIKNE